MDITEKVSLGTTTVAFRFRDGVLICADSRTSSDTRIVNRVSRKLAKLTDRIVIAVSGSLADTKFLHRTVQRLVYDHELALGRPCAVRTAAGLFSLFNHTYKSVLQAGILVGGHDADGYHCFKVGLGGTVTEAENVMSGSGSTYIMGMMDSDYRVGMTEEEAVAFAKKLVRHAALRDGSSGGVIRWVILKDGAIHGDIGDYEQLL